MKLKKNLVLVGMMGSGKTKISKAIAEELNVKVYSSDKLIEKKAKRTIAEIVAKKGWPYFRKLEHSIIKKLAAKKGVIIDCGGGVVLNPQNLKLLKKSGIIIFLKASVAAIYKRTNGDPKRPLVHTAANPLATIKKIYKERLPLYSLADKTVNTSNSSLKGPVARIISLVRHPRML